MEAGIGKDRGRGAIEQEGKEEEEEKSSTVPKFTRTQKDVLEKLIGLEFFDGLVPTSYVPQTEYKSPCWIAKDGDKNSLRCLPFFYVLGHWQSGGQDIIGRLVQHQDVLGTRHFHFWNELRPPREYWQGYQFATDAIQENENTKDLISKDLLKHFKRGSKLINLSRGGIVNNDDVIDALKNEVLSCFVTDFPSLELSRRSNESSDVILLPHIGASTAEAEINCAVMAAKQVVDFLKNGNIMNSVNFPRIKLSRSTDHRLVIINKNEPGMIGKIAEFIANEKLNISDMVNKSREDIAINLIDLDSKPSRELIQSLYKIEHVLSVRVC